jgi:type IV secretion system protein VirB5
LEKIMKSLRALLVMVVVAVSSSAASAQIPVTDVAGLAKQIEQVLALERQFSAMKEQIAQAEKLYGSLNKLTNMGDIAASLKDPAVRSGLGKNFSDVQAAMSGTVAQAETFRSANDAYGNPGSEFMASEMRRNQGDNAGQMSVAQGVFDAAQKRMSGIEELRNQIGSSEDPKTIADLQARLGAESLGLQNEMLKGQALAMLQVAVGRVEEQRQKDEYMKKIDGNLKVLGQ